MELTRREFLMLTAAACAGCTAVDKGGVHAGAAGAVKPVDAGPVSNYGADTVYTHFRDMGFFVIRSGGKLTALSSICTHQKCKLTAEPDMSFYCECHGSEFDPRGKVTEGPAKRDLPVLQTFVDGNGHLIVQVPVG